jgi:hypothetical protein
MRNTQRPLYLLLLAVVLLNTLLWLDSFDRYLSSRYHLTLSVVLPESAFTVSHHVQALIARMHQFGTAKPVVQLQDSLQRKPELDPPRLSAKVSMAAPAAAPTYESSRAAPDTAPAATVIAFASNAIEPFAAVTASPVAPVA